jgi:hypothetical protein
MMIVVRLGTLLGVLAVLVSSSACDGGDRPTAPTSPATGQPPPVQPSPDGGLAATATYVASGPLSYPIQDYTASSRYVLRDSGGFSLEYPSLRLEYAGTYTRDGGRLMFRFTADSRWGAMGTLTGDLLEVRYNDIMAHSDFEDAVYRRSP